MSINIGGGELKELKPRILVLGVGGAGGNAINAMIEAGMEGVLITKVDYDSGREGLRALRRGDVIVEVTQQKVMTVDDVKVRIEAQREADRSVVLLSIFRSGQFAHVPVELDEDE